MAEYIAELIAELSDQKVYLDGASKLLRFPEYRDTKKAQTLLDYMEDDSRHLLPATRKIDGIQFFIGPENGENPGEDGSDPVYKQQFYQIIIEKNQIRMT